MSAFWESFTDGAEATIETMGEDVRLGGRSAVQGVVQAAETHPRIVTGGKSPGVSHVIQVSLAVGDEVEDGDDVVTRQLTGKVVFKEHFGGGWLIHAGPENRAEEGEWD